MPPMSRPDQSDMVSTSQSTAAKDAVAARSKRILLAIHRKNLDLFVVIILSCYHHCRTVSAESEQSMAAYASDLVSFAPVNGRVLAEDHNSGSVSHGGQGHTSEDGKSIYNEEERASYTVLFPWFVEMMGVFIYYVLSRYAHAIPYTAIVFICGMFIGLAAGNENSPMNALTYSTDTWTGIDGHVILLVFLPGLLFLDSYNIDVHLFAQSFAQLFVFAFPMVLAGTSLTALVAYFIFPYGWSFDLCMTFGSILAATDPVAVAVLLNELGAPPRLKIHISGESLLNDGAAVVFFNIFSKRFFYEIGIPGVGDDIGWAQGFATFFRLSLGGMCIGLAFGAGTLLILYQLDRRLSGEDAVVQVVATFTSAYLVFFTSEILAGCSGIIAVLFCALTIKAFGETYYNDPGLSHHFWHITEYLLNTLLFALGGAVFGDIIALSYQDLTSYTWTSSDWGYLVMLYFFVNLIRFLLVFGFFPITARLGVGTNWREAVFMSYGGLRGAVGIALALVLHAETDHFTSASGVSDETRVEYLSYSSKMFGMVGGIALFTLIINGTSSGPLLKKLGLVTPSETRVRVLKNYRRQRDALILREYVVLLTQPRFQDVDFGILQVLVPYFRDITFKQLMAAVNNHKKKSPTLSYTPPDLSHVLPYLYTHTEILIDSKPEEEMDPRSRFFQDNKQRSMFLRQSAINIFDSRGDRKTVFDLRKEYNEDDVREERIIFLNVVRSSYERLIGRGELQARTFVSLTLGEALEFSMGAAAKGLPLSTWNAVKVASDSWVRPTQALVHWLSHTRTRRRLEREQKTRGHVDRRENCDNYIVQTRVKQILIFIEAHNMAREKFLEEFCQDTELTAAEKIVLNECDSQLNMAQFELDAIDKDQVSLIKTNYLAQILLNKGASCIKKMQADGLMTEKEAGEFLEEVAEYLRRLEGNTEQQVLSKAVKSGRLSLMPRDLQEFTIIEEPQDPEECIANQATTNEAEADDGQAKESTKPQDAEETIEAGADDVRAKESLAKDYVDDK
mmetsp:Transcript_28882/g.65754  ORF Transcript_28882/g.65754 Transcript_28882/m.65754 type:complete len:1017 (+) Transcript_28882:196-3246(+)